MFCLGFLCTLQFTSGHRIRKHEFLSFNFYSDFVSSEHADIVVGTPDQLLQVFNRDLPNLPSKHSDITDSFNDETSPTKRRQRHLLNHLTVLLLDDIHHLLTIEAAWRFLDLVKDKCRKYGE